MNVEENQENFENYSESNENSNYTESNLQQSYTEADTDRTQDAGEERPPDDVTNAGEPVPKEESAVSAAGNREADGCEKSGSPCTGGDERTDTAATSALSGAAKTDEHSTPGGHLVTFTVTIAAALPNVEADEATSNGHRENRYRKKRVVDAPKNQTHYHFEYHLVSNADDLIKTDVVCYGVAAKIFPERQDSKVVKTWQEGDRAWVAWLHHIKVSVTDEVLMKLHQHELVLKVWDTKDRIGSRARFDKAKAFRLPQARPGEDPDSAGGVKSLVMKQAKAYESWQSPKGTLSRPLPNPNTPAPPVMPQPPVTVTTEPAPKQNESPTPTARKRRARKEEKSKHVLEKSRHASRDQLDKMKERLGTAEGRTPRLASQQSNLLPVDENEGSVMSRDRAGLLRNRSRENLESRNRSRDESIGKSTRKSQGSPRERKPKTRKYDALQEEIRLNGVCSVKIKMAKLFSGIESVTERLDSPVSSMHDMFVSVRLGGPLMTAGQRRALNPLIIQVTSATSMPASPLDYKQLQDGCNPAYLRYKFPLHAEHRSAGKPQEKNIYWNDLNVVLTGIIENSALYELLNGPPLEIEIHDRDRKAEKKKTAPALFGDDLEDEKISNVQTVTSRRTVHNAFSAAAPWSPHGVARCDLSELLLGARLLQLSVPIHCGPTPDPLGMEPQPDGRVLGVSGAVDGPTDPPLPRGKYLESQANLKVRFELAYPLVTPGGKDAFPGATYECPFARIVYVLPYSEAGYLAQLEGLVSSINAQALDIDHMEPHVIASALSSYKLSLEQQQSRELDIVTGFHLLDGQHHLFVLEGLRDHAVAKLWRSLPRQRDSGVRVLYDSGLTHAARLYGPLDVDLCRTKLHEALPAVVTEPLLYVRDMVPRPAFSALTKLQQMMSCRNLKEACRNDLFPTSVEVATMSREFGVPMTSEDFKAMRPEPERADTLPVTSSRDLTQSTRRTWPELAARNEQFEARLAQRQRGELAPADCLTEHKNKIKKMSEDNRLRRANTMPVFSVSDVTAHNYSTQRLNSGVLATEEMRKRLAEMPDSRFTYSQDYLHSMTVLPEDPDTRRAADARAARGRWKTAAGWVYPGKRTSQQANAHPRRPPPSRQAELEEQWIENTLHANRRPTLDREQLDWHERKLDFDLWTRPAAIFGQEEPITIHLPGVRAQEEKTVAAQLTAASWQRRVVVQDTKMSFHRRAPQQPESALGPRSSNQLDRLHGLLKDPPAKLAMRLGGGADIPPLSVVLNPAVDTQARMRGQPLPPPDQDTGCHGYHPGPYLDMSWRMDLNAIPASDYRHQQFRESRGHDFNVYHKNRALLHNRRIEPLTDREYLGHRFRPPYDVVTGRDVTAARM